MPADVLGSAGKVLNTPLLVLCIAFPWLWPIAGGPTPTVLPWLVAAISAIVMAVLAMPMRTNLAQASGWGWLLAALLSSGIALAQYFGLSAALQPWVNVTPLGEAFGNLRQRNQFATLANMGVAVLLWQAPAFKLDMLAGRWSARDSLWLAWWSSGAMALLAIGNAVSASRTGLLQLAMLMLVVLISGGWRIRRMRILLTVGLVFYVAASALLPLLVGLHPFGGGAVSRFQADGLPCGSRIALWSNVLHLIGLKPWLGWGWGELDYGHFMTVYPGIRFCNILDNAHNLPLHLAVELGIPVALLVCGLIAWLVLRARPWRETRSERQTAWAVLALIGLHSLLEYPLWYGPFQIAVVLAVWTLWRTPAPGSDPAQVGHSASGQMTLTTIPMGTHMVRTVAALLISALTYVGWDYHRVSQIYKAPSLRSSAYREETLRKVQDSWLFRKQVRFAALTLATVTPENAQGLNTMARELLHFSPESRVIEKLIDSDLVLGRRDDAAYFMLRYSNAFPAEYERWKSRNAATALPELPPPGA